MKLKLNKQTITELSSKEMENVEGGKGGWSDFRTGNCNYSGKMPDNYLECTPNSDGTYDTVTISCVNS